MSSALDAHPSKVELDRLRTPSPPSLLPPSPSPSSAGSPARCIRAREVRLDLQNVALTEAFEELSWATGKALSRLKPDDGALSVAVDCVFIDADTSELALIVGVAKPEAFEAILNAYLTAHPPPMRVLLITIAGYIE
jgi:hypothetical protein